MSVFGSEERDREVGDEFVRRLWEIKLADFDDRLSEAMGRAHADCCKADLANEARADWETELMRELAPRVMEHRNADKPPLLGNDFRDWEAYKELHELMRQEVATRLALDEPSTPERVQEFNENIGRIADAQTKWMNRLVEEALEVARSQRDAAEPAEA